jgi:hypothetical protein
VHGGMRKQVCRAAAAADALSRATSKGQPGLAAACAVLCYGSQQQVQLGAGEFAAAPRQWWPSGCGNEEATCFKLKPTG